MSKQPILVLVAILVTATTHAQTSTTVAVPNPSFESGTNGPEGWKSSGEGAQFGWEQSGHSGRRAISVAGTKPEASAFWTAEGFKLLPREVYRFSFWSQAERAGGGSIISGPSVVNHDFLPSPDWKRYAYVLMMPTGGEHYVRLGLWNASGKVLFDDVAITKVVPLHRQRGDLELGDGESISNGVYNFNAPLQSTNYARPLVGATAGFNTNRWGMSSNAEIVYQHRVGGNRQRRASVEVTVGYYRGGRLIVEASRDQKEWLPVGELSKLGSLTVELPAALFPAETMSLRLRAAAPAQGTGDSTPAAFQIYGYAYRADLEDTAPDLTGQTTFVEENLTDATFPVTMESLGELRPGGKNVAQMSVSHTGPNATPLLATLSFEPSPGATDSFQAKATAGPGKTTVEIPYQLLKAGAFAAKLTISAASKPVYRAEAEFNVPAPYAADYGYALHSGPDGDVWWAEAPYKISRERPVPLAKSDAVEIRAARHEYEPFQIVVRPKRDISGATVTASDLVGPSGARIGREHVSMAEVAYVNIKQATDYTGVIGAWPDPLPPLAAPLDLKANRNQPFWVTVYVPEQAKPGLYRSEITISAPGWQQKVPVRLVVHNFALPKETHVQSGFGLSPSLIKRYHNLETTAEVAQVMDRYYRNFAAHRISPYDPVFNAPIKLDWGTFGGALWPGGQLDSDKPFAGRQSLRVRDDNEKSSVGATYANKIPVEPGQPYTLRLAVRAAKPGQTYQVSLNTHDASGEWISGHNLNINRQGSGAWEEVTVDISAHLKPPMRFVTVGLRPIPWAEDGTGTGVAWFDDIRFSGADGKNLIEDSDFEGTVDPSQVKVDFTAFDEAAHRAFEQYRFTAWRLPIQGLGGGTFHERYPGRIGPYEAGSPEYEALMGSYLRQLQEHLEAKGWLDKAYIYWFDEPDPKDYAFVRDTNERIKKYAPKLTRMLTEQPEPELIGTVDLWCPVTSSFDPQRAAERMKAGERFWWYVCTGPKAPYVTLFIDHPAVEMRTWLWQTWKYGVRGILVWESNYWTSDAAYPNSLQNPWEDPMSWVSGYSQPAGAKTGWGNGDGRFLYPPNRQPGIDKSKFLGGPINSIRWEMLREGIEDYEYFHLLRRQIEAAKKRGVKPASLAPFEQLLQVPPSVTSDLTTFSTSPQPIYEHREKLAEAIEALIRLMQEA
ncbi:MAG: DUF6067 family protein, partial [Armatimonadota bacterium]|nr:DUF6067 family protein [Armatimonadota bacterium]